MIDVSAAITSEAFMQPYTILRNTGGKFGPGGWLGGDPVPIQAYGVVSTLTEAELVQVPEGDRVLELRGFHCVNPLYETSEDRKATSDLLSWRGTIYRISRVFDYSAFGYYKAAAVRIAGN